MASLDHSCLRIVALGTGPGALCSRRASRSNTLGLSSNGAPRHVAWRVDMSTTRSPTCVIAAVDRLLRR
ncbi:hypothetical protein VI08_09175 [Luteibacter yeojuensis]|uniref:Uncharacterized protein n=1 Tax=Luteibacter yeojuensis TaxID=345309 RepID=A0A0F3KXB9_9GAMM|nr:hypothetical protein VI08_09175 [Luteibacter yeojuensis]